MKKKFGVQLENIFATQYIQQWLDKSGIRKELELLKEKGPLSAKAVRSFFNENWKRFGWSSEDRRRWKRAAVLILRQL